MTRKVVGTLILIGLTFSALALAACSTRTQAAEREVEEVTAVVEEFYTWYLAYPGNPFADQIYRESSQLAPAFIEAADANIEAMRAAGPGGGDIFLCAQDIPGDIRYSPAEVDGEQATVMVQEVWNPDSDVELIHEVTVQLEQNDDNWLITAINCPGQ